MMKTERAVGLIGLAALALCGCRSGRMIQMTFGPGNDTEAAWSPDGREIAFQTDRAGDLDIAVLDAVLLRPRSERNGEGKKEGVTVLVGGAGHACYPAWTPDGGLVYAFGLHEGTAVQAEQAKAECGYGLRLLKDGETTVLTRGHWRDYTPSVTADGAAVYYASTQGAADAPDGVWKERVAIRRVALPDASTTKNTKLHEKGGQAWCNPAKAGTTNGECAPGSLFRLQPGEDGQTDAPCVTRCSSLVLPMDGDTKGAVQPSLSPDGRFLLWAGLDGFRSNWRICAARAEAPSDSVFLTPGEMSAYAPRWSPDGRFIAFTGFRDGDPGWGLFLLEPRSGALVRLETGPGNSRSPAWSPDGRELVFENNRTGVYKLYRMAVVPPPPAAVWTGEGAAASGDGTTDDARVPFVAPADAGGERVFERPAGLDFGQGTFYVKMTLVLNAVEKGIRVAAVGRYAEHPLGWQVIVRENGRVSFCPRSAEGGFLEVASKEPLVPGRAVEVLGVREADGTARLYLDGALQGRCDGAGLAYGPALSVCLGRQWSGGMKLNGRVTAFECGRGWPAGVPRPVTSEELFGGGTK